MSQQTRNIIVFICISVIAVCFAIGLHLYFFYEILDAAVVAAIGFCALLAIYNHLLLNRKLANVDEYILDIRQFEKNITKRLNQIESKIAKSDVGKHDRFRNEADTDPNNDSSSLAQIDHATEILGRAASAWREQDSQTGSASSSGQVDSIDGSDNIIELNSRLKQKEISAGGKQFKIKPSQLTKALNNDGGEIFLQPILELPTRNIRYFEAFIRLRIGDNILAAKQFMPAAKDRGQIARINLLSLELTFKVVRGLQRQGNEYPVFWNIAPQSLGNKKIFDEILEQLRANQPLNHQLICEISHSSYSNLNIVQSNNLALIRDLGYEMSIDKVKMDSPGDISIAKILSNGIFGIVKIPAAELISIGKGDITNFADYIVPVAINNNITLIASEVESDAQTISMIDSEVYLAQGNALIPAKALKKELSGI